MKPVILLAEAVEDLENARDFYDRQEQRGRRLLRALSSLFRLDQTQAKRKPLMFKLVFAVAPF